MHAGAQENDSIPGLEIDSVDVIIDELKKINDYSMIGIQYGMGMSRSTTIP